MKNIQALIFDYDGVIAESNEIKLSAFRELFKEEKKEDVQKLINFHIKHEGISRLKKIEHFYNKVLKKEISDKDLKLKSKHFSSLVMNKVIACKKVKGVRKFLISNSDKYKYFISTGTPTEEIKIILKETKMYNFFQEIYGSPGTKIEHISKIIQENNFNQDSLVFIGDSNTDLLAAEHCKIKFILRSHKFNKEIDCSFGGVKFRDFYQLQEYLDN